MGGLSALEWCTAANAELEPAVAMNAVASAMACASAGILECLPNPRNYNDAIRPLHTGPGTRARPLPHRLLRHQLHAEVGIGPVAAGRHGRDSAELVQTTPPVQHPALRAGRRAPRGETDGAGDVPIRPHRADPGDGAGAAEGMDAAPTVQRPTRDAARRSARCWHVCPGAV